MPEWGAILCTYRKASRTSHHEEVVRSALFQGGGGRRMYPVFCGHYQRWDYLNNVAMQFWFAGLLYLLKHVAFSCPDSAVLYSSRLGRRQRTPRCGPPVITAATVCLCAKRCPI